MILLFRNIQYNLTSKQNNLATLQSKLNEQQALVSKIYEYLSDFQDNPTSNTRMVENDQLAAKLVGELTQLNLNEVENTEFWRPWQDRHFDVPGQMAYDMYGFGSYTDMLSSLSTEGQSHLLLTIHDTPEVIANLKQVVIASYSNISAKQIGDNIGISYPSGTFHIRDTEVYNVYRIHYNYQEPAPEVADSILNEIALILEIISEISSYQFPKN
ncbi:hypothetical protein [Candidatus Tisiphia endosymbiont of Mystacides longicornis]|uniref:hypothetical protein n=1 Tax=Candidatus Tisiphia endosymbiont of Mystacides longicornis TaxID=3139330 RepID=UPI003CCB66F4